MHAFRFAAILFCVAIAAQTSQAAQKKPDPKAPKAPAPASNGMETVTLPVTGMMCRNCAAAVSTTFKKIDGVTEATADGDKIATITFDPKKITIEKLVESFATTNKDDRFKAYKPGEKPPEPKFNYSGKPETLSGSITIRTPDNEKNVVARIITHRAGEPAQRIINLIAESAVAEKIEAKRKEGVPISVTGVVSEAGIKVEKVD